MKSASNRLEHQDGPQFDNPPWTSPEQEAIRAKCFHPVGTFVEFEKEEVDQSIPQRFEKIVGAFPDRIAVKSLGQVLTYDALNKAANRIAHAILAVRSDIREPIFFLLNI